MMERLILCYISKLKAKNAQVLKLADIIKNRGNFVLNSKETILDRYVIFYYFRFGMYSGLCGHWARLPAC